MQKGSSEYVSAARENALFLLRSHIHFPKAFSTFLPEKFSVTSAGKRGRVRKKSFSFPSPLSAYVHERDIRKCFLWKPAITPTAIVEATILGFFFVLFPLGNCYVANIFTRLPVSWILPFVPLPSCTYSRKSTVYRGGVLFDILSWSEEERKRDWLFQRLFSASPHVRAFAAPTLTSVFPSFSFFYPSLLLRWTPSSVLPPLLSNSWRKKYKKRWRKGGLERRGKARTRNPL